MSIAERIAKVEAECSGVWSTYNITSWERARLAEWKDRPFLTEKQLVILAQIEAKAFPESEGGNDE